MTDNENLHECDEMKMATRDYSEVMLRRNPDVANDWLYTYRDNLLDEWANYVYVHNFRYCPFCGEELK